METSSRQSSMDLGEMCTQAASKRTPVQILEESTTDPGEEWSASSTNTTEPEDPFIDFYNLRLCDSTPSLQSLIATLALMSGKTVRYVKGRIDRKLRRCARTKRFPVSAAAGKRYQYAKIVVDVLERFEIDLDATYLLNHGLTSQSLYTATAIVMIALYKRGRSQKRSIA